MEFAKITRFCKPIKSFEICFSTWFLSSSQIPKNITFLLLSSLFIALLTELYSLETIWSLVLDLTTSLHNLISCSAVLCIVLSRFQSHLICSYLFSSSLSCSLETFRSVVKVVIFDQVWVVFSKFKKFAGFWSDFQWSRFWTICAINLTSLFSSQKATTGCAAWGSRVPLLQCCLVTWFKWHVQCSDYTMVATDIMFLNVHEINRYFRTCKHDIIYWYALSIK